MKHLVITGLLAMLSFAGFSQREIEFVEYDLDNGIHVILHEEHSTPIVAVSVLYHVGSKNERTDRTGFAHFFEHLLFEGSENIGRGEYSELIEKNGGTLNANTSWDRTFYFELLPSNQLELGLWLESERMLHAKVDSVGIETQRSVVKEEKRQRDVPYSSFIEEMFSRMYAGHPYSWMPIGSMEHLDAAEEADYVNFYRTFYVPANATLSIAGDIDIDETKAWIKKYFGSIPKGEAINLFRDLESLDDAAFTAKYDVDKSAFNLNNFNASKDKKAAALVKKMSATPVEIPRPDMPKNKLTTAEKFVVEDEIQLPALFIGYQIPEQTNEDMYAIEMMNEVLSGGASSRINKSLVEQKQMAVQAFSVAFGLEQAGVALFGAIAAQGKDLDSIQMAFDEEIQRIKTEPISDEEYEKIQNQYENLAISSNSTISGISENLADSHVYNGGADKVNSELQNYLDVTKEDIMRVANKYLTEDARIILHYVPMEEDAEESK